MAVLPTYPGVYIQEIPSGVQTIASVATSITAFVGRMSLGPVETPTTCFNFGDFVRLFGGLAVDRPLSYAVRDFFANGGSQALIVRLFSPNSPTDTGVATITVGGTLHLVAAFPGAWGAALTATISFAKDTSAVSAIIANLGLTGLTPNDFFDLTLTDTARTVVEAIRNVSVAMTAGPRRVDRVLADASNLMRLAVTGTGDPDLPGARPAEQANASPAAGSADDGKALVIGDFQGEQTAKTGLYALEKADLFNILCIPPDVRGIDVPSDIWGIAATYCVQRRAVVLVDPPSKWGANPQTAVSTILGDMAASPPVTGIDARNAALFFPRLVMSDPLRQGQQDSFVPCGAVAGIMAGTDADRGVWKAAAGINAGLVGVNKLEVPLTDNENGQLNPIAVNCLRSFPNIGPVVWGARTLRGSDQLGDEYRYVPVRRLALFIEESLFRGTQWVVFEPNDTPLWAQIRMNVGAFMQRLFRQGAFQGSTPREAYFVKCDSETTTPDDVNNGIVNIIVGFAPLRPAEFVIISIQQISSNP